MRIVATHLRQALQIRESTATELQHGCSLLLSTLSPWTTQSSLREGTALPARGYTDGMHPRSVRLERQQQWTTAGGNCGQGFKDRGTRKKIYERALERDQPRSRTLRSLSARTVMYTSSIRVEMVLCFWNTRGVPALGPSPHDLNSWALGRNRCIPSEAKYRV